MILRSDPTDPVSPSARVRQADAADGPAIGVILAEALAAKYRPALGDRAAIVIAGLVRDELADGQRGFLVADLDGAVVGAAHLATVEALGPPSFTRGMVRRIGPLRTLRALIVLMLLRQAPLSGDEAHIGELGVLAQARRRGVATALLVALEQRARALGKRRVTLWVTRDNRAAVDLYEGRGFRRVRERCWPVGRLVFRSGGLVLMEKTLGGDR